MRKHNFKAFKSGTCAYAYACVLKVALLMAMATKSECSLVTGSQRPSHKNKSFAFKSGTLIKIEELQNFVLLEVELKLKSASFKSKAFVKISDFKSKVEECHF